VRVLSRAWQMLVKGIEEVAEAPRPLAAADMVLVRLCHAADLPTPDEAIRMLGANGGSGVAPAPRPAARAGGPSPAPVARARLAQPLPRTEPQAVASSAPELRRFEDVVARARAEREIGLATALERHVRPIRFDPGQVEVALTAEADPDLPQKLGAALQAWTGRRWIVVIGQEQPAVDTVHEARKKSQAAVLQEVRADPLVRKVLDRFPGAEIVGVRERVVVPPDETAPPWEPDASHTAMLDPIDED
jgi:DNA polymerase-3 subunit gamma/tau